MEFTNFYTNIKTEGGPQHYGPPGGSVGGGTHAADKQKVNPFMQWAVASIQGFYFSGPPGTGGGPGGAQGAAPHPPSSESPGHPLPLTGQPSHPPPTSTPGITKEEEQRPLVSISEQRPVTISSSTAQDTGRQVVQAMQGGGQHYQQVHHMVQPLDHQQQHHTQHQQQSAECEQQVQLAHGGAAPSNDTAFPGGHLRHNYPGMGGQQGGHLGHGQQNKPGPTKHTASKKIYTEENGQVVAYNGSAEHMARNSRGEKVERVYDCSGCDKAFTREEHLKRHAKSHTDEPVHTCEVIGCTKSYTRKERLTRHYKVAHLGQEPERPFWCEDCGKDFQRKEHLTRHQRNIHGPGGSQGLEMREYKQQVGQQQQPGHQQVRPPAAGQQQGGGGGSVSSNHHQGGQGGSLRCTYEGCPKTYSRREHLNRHIKLHMGIEPDRPYYCHDCGKTFTRKEHLLRHRRSHTGETPYPCPGTCLAGVECTKQFARKEHLKRHLRVHTGDHQYPCNECGRSFGRRERLLKHMKSHGIGLQPKKEFKKEPEFVQDSSHGVFGDQTNHLLRMIAQKGPISPQELSTPQPVAPAPAHTNGTGGSSDLFLAKPEVARALSNPEVIAAFSNPDVVKAFALSPPKKGPGGTTPPPSQVAGQPPATRGPDIANSPAVPPELSKLPPGFSIFPVVAPASQGGGQAPAPEQGGQGGAQVQVGGNSYYQAGPSYVASVPGHRPGELTTIPMSWAGWPMSGVQAGAMVNIRSPAKVEPGAESKHWEPSAAAYFRSPFS